MCSSSPRREPRCWRSVTWLRARGLRRRAARRPPRPGRAPISGRRSAGRGDSPRNRSCPGQGNCLDAQSCGHSYPEVGSTRKVGGQVWKRIRHPISTVTSPARRSQAGTAPTAMKGAEALANIPARVCAWPVDSTPGKALRCPGIESSISRSKRGSSRTEQPGTNAGSARLPRCAAAPTDPGRVTSDERL